MENGKCARWQFPVMNNREQQRGENKRADIERTENSTHSAIHKELKAHDLGEEEKYLVKKYQ